MTKGEPNNLGRILMNFPVEDVPVSALRLDDKNPRLPERLHGASQSQIREYLVRNGNLEELAQSLLDNGYFAAEPMVADQSGTVLEGNRRLAALQIILSLDTDLELPQIRTITDWDRQRLQSVPVVRVSERSVADRFIAFRHIGGLKEWEPEAKARYVYRAIRELNAAGEANPFQALASRVGSNSQSMRAAYLAMALLQYAYSEFGINVNSVQNDRFGVWTRAMSSREIREFMGLREARTVSEIDEMLKSVNKQGIETVIGDMTPKDGARPAIADSRHLSTYGKILSNERARTVFARFGYDVASRIVELSGVSERIQKLIAGCKELVETITEADEPPEPECAAEADLLIRHARALQSAIQVRLS